MNPITVFEISVGILFLGAIVSALVGKNRQLVGQISFVFALLAAIGLFYTAMSVFINGAISSGTALFDVPGIGASLMITIDQLSAFFLALIAILSLLSSLYAVKFMCLPVFKELSLRAYYPFMLIFFAGISCLVAMGDLFFFFIFWEIMTLTSYTLVIFNKDQQERLRAGFKYFFMTHVATALMFLGAIIVYTHSRSFAFSEIGATMNAMAISKPGILHLVLVFFFLGFATKAGILPFGDWLPDAYPSAPTPAAATFGGIMSKLGIYGLLRIFLGIAPTIKVSHTWGLILAIFGVISIFIGSITALSQDDSKKLLAFSVVGQMGYILLGVGISIYFLPTAPILGTIALIATLFHLMNNVFFKSCLFYNAGSIFYVSGTRNLNEVGGLGQIMPLTAFTSIIAGLSMAGIPLLSGFSSKWLFFQASFDSGIRVPIFMVFAIVALFVSIVTLAYAIKFFGTAFFGKFNPGAASAGSKDVPATMAIPQIVMAALCILFGIFPLLAIQYSGAAVQSLLGSNYSNSLAAHSGNLLAGLQLNFGGDLVATWSPIIILLAGIVCFLISFLIFRSGGATQREQTTWYCGEEHSDEEVRVQARGLYLTFKQMFRIRIGKYEKAGVYPSIEYPKITLTEGNLLRRFFNIDNWFFYPITSGFMRLMRYFSASHVGMPHVYLLWLVIGTIIAIIILFTLSAVSA